MATNKTKLHFFPMSRLDKAEAWLSKMEADGWRLDGAKFPYVFYFKRNTPRHAKYFFTQFSKTLQLQNMASQLEEEGWIKEFTNGTSMAVYRKPDQEGAPAQVPQKHLTQRFEMLKTRTFNNALFCLIIGIIATSFLFFDPNPVFSIIVLSVAFLLAIYYIVGNVYVRKKLSSMRQKK